MWYIYKKELKTYFSTPFGFIFIGIFLLASGIVFTVYNLLGGNGDMTGMFSILSNISVMVFPVLTMRSFADERRAGTDKLLRTSRLNDYQIVVGKYLAAFTVFLTAVCATGFYVFLLAQYGYPNYSSIMGSYIGFILLGATFISICLFAAALCETHVTAAIFSFGLLFFVVIAKSFGSNLQIPVIKDIVNWIAITSKYDDFSRGILTLHSIVYYIGFSVFMVFISVKAEESQRYK
ncbi:ABC transporter permease subunit [Chakrabartyella piscis]|uniref:ABC transporter permease subunit n=1 Tax=Chakrabartyella piscis TaxID=2918914 RepID=UPI002958B1F1|nr:ABC transporter permease subunit [Chakrabartyella piscis]